MAGPKDNWDKLRASSAFIASVVLGIVTLYVNASFNERQANAAVEQKKKDDQLARIKALSDFMPHLSGQPVRREAALYAISALGWSDLTLKLAALKVDLATNSPAVDGAMRGAPGSSAPSPVSAAPPMVGNAVLPYGWVYLGDWSGNGWRTRYLKFGASATPTSLANQVLDVDTPLNVRRGMPTPEGEFPAIIDVLQPGKKVRLGAVLPWQATGYQWAPITLGPWSL